MKANPPDPAQANVHTASRSASSARIASLPAAPPEAPHRPRVPTASRALPPLAGKRRSSTSVEGGGRAGVYGVCKRGKAGWIRSGGAGMRRIRFLDWSFLNWRRSLWRLFFLGSVCFRFRNEWSGGRAACCEMGRREGVYSRIQGGSIQVPFPYLTRHRRPHAAETHSNFHPPILSLFKADNRYSACKQALHILYTVRALSKALSTPSTERRSGP